jgi:DNA-binding XRE family transcriptional regulator
VRGTERILDETAPSRIADAVAKLDDGSMVGIEASLPRALAGDREQVRAYIDAYTRLADRVLAAIEVDSSGRQPWLRMVLLGEATSAPFSHWVGSLEPGRGTAVAMVQILRSTLPGGGRPISPPARRRLPKWEIGEGDVVRFYRAVAAMLGSSEHPLERIRDTFGLNRTEAAALFGVRRQALEGWERAGVPSRRQAKLATIGVIADLLEARLRDDRIPGVVRRQAPAYSERSILEAIAGGDEELVLERLREGFDWAGDGI